MILCLKIGVGRHLSNLYRQNWVLGVDALLDVIILQSQMMDLKANISVPAAGYILESRMEKGRGPVATVICQHGLLKIGDYFIAGAATGTRKFSC